MITRVQLTLLDDRELKRLFRAFNLMNKRYILRRLKNKTIVSGYRGSSARMLFFLSLFTTTKASIANSYVKTTVETDVVLSRFIYSTM